MKIDKISFIRDFVIGNGFSKYNTNAILIKASFTINIGKLKDYEKTDC